MAKPLPHGSVDRNRARNSVPLWSAPAAPSRERGSKLQHQPLWRRAGMPLPHGSVDRNSVSGTRPCSCGPPLPHGSVDRNRPHRADGLHHRRPLPHGSVDRNGRSITRPCATRCRSLTGAWIETAREWKNAASEAAAPSRERGSKPRAACRHRPRAAPLPHGSVDRNRAVTMRLVSGSSRSLTGAWIETGRKGMPC